MCIEASPFALPPYKIWDEISETLVISESIPNGFSVSIDCDLGIDSAFPPRYYLDLTKHFTVTLFLLLLKASIFGVEVARELLGGPS